MVLYNISLCWSAKRNNPENVDLSNFRPILGVTMSAEKPLQGRGPVTESPIQPVVCPSVNPMNSAPVQRQQIQLWMRKKAEPQKIPFGMGGKKSG